MIHNSLFKKYLIFAVIFFGFLGLAKASPAFALDTPTIVATAKGPNQINLTWSAVANPGWGYKVEIQSNGDSRYTAWTDYTATLQNGFGYLPYWVTEGHYLDRSDGSGTVSGTCIVASTACGSAAQLMVFGLKYGTTYNFRVRTYGQTDAKVAVYSDYSNTASATTLTPSTIRHVKAGGPYGAGDGTSEANAWGHLYNANGVSGGTLVIIHGGSYSNEYLDSPPSGTQTNRTVFQTDPGEAVTITGVGAQDFLYFPGDYMIFDGSGSTIVTATTQCTAPTIQLTGSRNIITGFEIDGGARVGTDMGYSPYIIGNYNTVENLYWHNFGTYAPPGGSGAPLFYGNYNIFRNAKCSDFAHDCGAVRGLYNAFLNSYHNANGFGMCFEIEYASAGYNLVEGMRCTLTGAGALYKPGTEIAGGYTTLRRSVFYNNYDHNVELSTAAGGTPHDSLIYNNVFYQSGQADFRFMGPGCGCTNITIANNILYKGIGYVVGSGFTSPKSIIVDGTYTGTVFKNDSILQQTTGVDDPTRAIVAVSGDNNYTVAQAIATFPTYFSATNLTITPSFLDQDNNEFHLKSTSALRGQGVLVTDANWGTTGETDLGAYRYFDISSASPDTTPPAAPSGVTII